MPPSLPRNRLPAASSTSARASECAVELLEVLASVMLVAVCPCTRNAVTENGSDPSPSPATYTIEVFLGSIATARLTTAWLIGSCERTGTAGGGQGGAPVFGRKNARGFLVAG